MTSILKVDSIQNAAGSVTIPVMAGGIIQVKYTQFTGTNTVALSANTDTVLTDLTVNITPTATNSVILLQAHVFGEHSVSSANQWDHMFFFYRDTTKLAAPAAGSRRVGISMATATYGIADDGSTPEVCRYDYFDSPSSTSQITYKVGLNVVGAANWHLNSTVDDSDNNQYERGTSYISATEIAQ